MNGRQWLVIFLLALHWDRIASQTEYEEALRKWVVSTIGDLQIKMNMLQTKTDHLFSQIRSQQVPGSVYANSSPSAVDRQSKCRSNIGNGSTCYWVDYFGCYCILANGHAKSWTEARRYCRDSGMELVSLETVEEQEQVTQLLRNNLQGRGSYDVEFWTSGSDEEVEGQWKWTATGQKMDYSNWLEGQPDNQGGIEHNLIISRCEPFDWWDGARNNGTVQWHRNVICEGPPPSLEEKIQRLEHRRCHKSCPTEIGFNSTCQRIQGFGCYCLVQIDKGRNAASRHCQDYGMELVSVESKEEQSQLANWLNTNRKGRGVNYHRNFWTSGWDEHLDGDWKWAATGQKVAFNNWKLGKADNAAQNEQALQMDRSYPYKWHDHAVVDTSDGLPWISYFICES